MIILSTEIIWGFSQGPVSPLEQAVFYSSYRECVATASTAVSTPFSKLPEVEPARGIGSFIYRDSVFVVLDGVGQRHGPNATLIKNIYVDPENRGIGWASEVVELLKKLCRQSAPHILIAFPHAFKLRCKVMDLHHYKVGDKLDDSSLPVDDKYSVKRFWTDHTFKDKWKYSKSNFYSKPVIYTGKTTTKQLREIANGWDK